MGIEITYSDDEIFTIFIDEIEIENDGENFIVPKHLFKDKNVNELPENVKFDICWQHLGNVIHQIGRAHV